LQQPAARWYNRGELVRIAGLDLPDFLGSVTKADPEAKPEPPQNYR